MQRSAAESGIVNTQAQTIVLATPQRTDDRRLVAPTPMMAPVMVWVVLTGIPPKAVPSKVMAPAVSAQNPPTGLSLVIFCPIVFTILQPPTSFPGRSRHDRASTTQNGMLKVGK